LASAGFRQEQRFRLGRGGCRGGGHSGPCRTPPGGTWTRLLGKTRTKKPVAWGLASTGFRWAVLWCSTAAWMRRTRRKPIWMATAGCRAKSRSIRIRRPGGSTATARCSTQSTERRRIGVSARTEARVAGHLDSTGCRSGQTPSKKGTVKPAPGPSCVDRAGYSTKSTERRRIGVSTRAEARVAGHLDSTGCRLGQTPSKKGTVKPAPGPSCVDRAGCSTKSTERRRIGVSTRTEARVAGHVDSTGFRQRQRFR
jgi:hypothetical protein